MGLSKSSEELRGEARSHGGDCESRTRTGSSLKKIALWAGLVLCVAFIAWVAWGFLEFNHDVDNPKEGGFSGWQCDAGRDCAS
ncbi:MULTISPECIES: hypothetical protein [unclassified Streptomyces]|uniref:hypothetical protein n=1 Tax=unclassified Streptomyces TaxID=2593676 RepID=UPI000DB9F7E0|nr:MULTISPECIES: hypothetical protein [unclassified Streptomyces]MYT72486.1 hypothetical protein [Streptomyces sp. SID8367]